MDSGEKMEDKILLELSKENMQDLYDACVSYREELYGLTLPISKERGFLLPATL